jgi:hypothetical protein
MSSNAIQWFENPAFDAPELKSPQPCIHGAGCVYTKKTADGVVVPGVCHFVHPGEEGRGRRLFPARTIRFEHPDGEHLVGQPACVRLIGGALYYERMRMRMPWQDFCAVRGIPFTPNKPGVFREPVRRIPIGASLPPPTDIQSHPIRHIRTMEGHDFLVTGECVTRLTLEEATRFGLRLPKPVSAVAAADQSWPVLGGGSVGVTAVGDYGEAAPPVPHAVVEREVIEASAASVWRDLRRTSGDGQYDSHESDNCDECGRPVELCPERGDHGDERRELAEKAMLYYGVS